LAITGCKTYYLSPESLRTQLQSAGYAETKAIGPFGNQLSYKTTQLEIIKCTNNMGAPVELVVAPNIEMRITDTSGKRRSMYFDRTELSGDTLFGHPSYILSNMTYQIPFTTITKVELQLGGKRLRYKR
jgi:hypothetical protein